MSRIGASLDEPRRGGAVYGCVLARDRFWQDERLRVIGTHPKFPDAAYRLDLSEPLAHALVLVLSRLPRATRRPFADSFYERRCSSGWLPVEPRAQLGLAAGAVLLAVDLAEPPIDERVVDLLQGAAQRDDLTRTPAAALAETVARFPIEAEDVSEARAGVAVAVADVLAPSSDVVALQAVLARASYAAVETWEPSRVLDFLLEVDGLFARS